MEAVSALEDAARSLEQGFASDKKLQRAGGDGDP